MIVFKGESKGRIAKMEFASYPTTNHYRCQENAWMDKAVMVAWVDEVLAPYVATVPEHVVPLLILDSYRCRMMGSVVQRIQELGVEVQPRLLITAVISGILSIPVTVTPF